MEYYLPDYQHLIPHIKTIVGIKPNIEFNEIAVYCSSPIVVIISLYMLIFGDTESGQNHLDYCLQFYKVVITGREEVKV